MLPTAPCDEGQTWNDLPSGGQNINTWGNTASIYNSGDNLLEGDTYGTGSPLYIPFYFTDTSAGDVTKYGYVALSITTSGSGPAADLTLALTGLAYQNTAATQIGMGAVPESTSAVLVLGAGAFASLGLFRKKRKN